MRRTPSLPPSPDAPAAAEELPNYPLSQILAQLKTPEPELLAALRELQSEEELVAAGSRVATDRVLGDGPRIVSAAFHHRVHGSKEVQAVLDAVGLTEPLIAAAVHFLLELASLKQRHDTTSTKSSANRSKVRERAEEDRSAAVLARDAAIGVLEFIARGDADLSAKYKAVAGAGASAADLGRQLEQLADLGDAVLGHSGSKVKALRSLRGFTDKKPKEWRRLREALLKSDEALRTMPPAERVSQSELDRMDGLCLLVLRDVLRTLDLASQRTPQVRRVTLYSLRTYFRYRSPASDEPAHDVPAGGPPAEGTHGTDSPSPDIGPGARPTRRRRR